MKISIFGKILMADFAAHLGKRYLNARDERKKQAEKCSPAPGPSFHGYTREEAIQLIHDVFDSPEFQRRWSRDRTSANTWVLCMAEEKFQETFGFPKPKPAADER